jgi:Bacterial regulatory proteins, luxR family
LRTAHEAQIARSARDELTNPEIAARLFLSARTVQYCLGNIFAKLGISSRSPGRPGHGRVFGVASVPDVRELAAGSRPRLAA